MIYETTILLSTQLSNERVLPLWEKLVKEIEAIGGKIEKEVKPFEKKLAYPIKKNGVKIRQAHVGIVYLVPSQKPSVFTNILLEFLKAQDSILRFMVSRFSAIPEQRARYPRQSGFLTSLIKTQDKERAANTFETISQEEKNKKSEKPVKEEIDKKIEEILEDKISF